jgi:hypothetical protein
VRAIALASVVLPVPADPRRIITGCPSRQAKNRVKQSTAKCCSRVGGNPTSCSTRNINSSIVMLCSQSLLHFAHKFVSFHERKTDFFKRLANNSIFLSKFVADI